MRLSVIEHGVVDSTNERALSALAAGSARHGDLFVATGQSAGRGRRGTRWASPTGEGVYATLVVVPEPPPPHPAALTMAAGLAVLATVRALGAAEARLKWPNDVLVGAEKLAGILVESRGLDPAAPRYVVGVGLDCLQREFPPEIPGTSLARLGVPTAPADALEVLAPRLGQHIDMALADGERTARDYLEALGLRGLAVRATSGEQAFEGELLELTIEGGLTLAAADAEVVALPLAHVRAVERLDPAG